MHTFMEVAQIAAGKGVRLINISDHGKASGNNANFGVLANEKRIPNPIICLDGSSILLIRGMEANILDVEGNTDITEFCKKNLDLISAGFHPFGTLEACGDEKINTKALINTVQKNPIDIFTHPCIRTFPVDLSTIVDMALAYGFAVELNNTHLRLGKEEMEKVEALVTLCMDKGVLMVENSDGHTYHEIGENEKIEELLTAIGLDGDKVLMNRDDEKLEDFIRMRKAKRL